MQNHTYQSQIWPTSWHLGMHFTKFRFDDNPKNVDGIIKIE